MKDIHFRIYKNFILFFLVFSVFLFSGCVGRDDIEIHLAKQEHDFDLTPVRKNDGKPFNIAFMDIEPPIESSYLCLKGFVEGLQSMGYIRNDLKIESVSEDFYDYYKILADSDLGGYVKFLNYPYVVDDGENKDIAEDLKNKTASGEIDIIVSTGTTAGLFLKNLNLGVPFLVCLATDPVASGIIKSAEDTGNDNIWALVEPNPYKRQFRGYKLMLSFDKIGMVTVNGMDTITGNPLYREEAAALGVEVVEINFNEDEMRAENYTEIILKRLSETDMSDFDAVLFAYGTMDDNNAQIISDYMSEKGIPTLIGDGDSICKNGGMMCLSCFDYERYGNYASMVCSNIMHGKKAGAQPCIYTSSPHIVLNMTTAEKTGFKCSFDFLRSIDRIYR